MNSRSSVLIACTALVFVLGAAPARAQVRTQFGVEGGLNVANIDFTASDDFNPTWDSRNRGVGGFVVAWDFSNPGVGLQIDVLYTQKGAKTSFVEDGLRVNFDASLDYVEIPILIRGNMRASDAVTFRVFGGPAVAFKVSDDVKATVDGVDIGEEADAEFKSYDFSLVAGAAAQFGRFFIDARYTWGLVNVIDDDDEEEVKGRTFGIMVGVMFN